MGNIERFEDLEIWIRTREICKDIFAIRERSGLKNDYRLYEINGSSGSVMDNIAEGFERDGNREYVQFLSVAKSSMWRDTFSIIQGTRQKLYQPGRI